MHDLTRAAEISDDILIIDGGIKYFYGSREECLKTGAIENCFNVRRTTYENRKIETVPMSLLVQLGSVVDFNVPMLETVFGKIGQHPDKVFPAGRCFLTVQHRKGNILRDPQFVPALYQTEFDFKLSAQVEELIQGTGNANKEIIFTVAPVSGGSVIEKKISMEELKKGQEGDTYKVILDGLAKDTDYTVYLSAVLSGGQGSKPVIFKDVEGKDGYFNFRTLKEVDITIKNEEIIDEYYNYKMIQLLYDVDSITGVQFRYDIYDVTDGIDKDNPDPAKLAYSYEELQERSAKTGADFNQFDPQQRFFQPSKGWLICP